MTPFARLVTDLLTPGAGLAGPSVSPLATALRSAARRCVGSTQDVTVLYSGGLDSSLAAFLLAPVVPVRLLVLAAEGGKDLDAARAGAKLLGLPLREERVTETDLVQARGRFPEEFAGLGEPLLSVDLALAVGFSRVVGRTVVVGQGADELFYGYAHFRGLEPARARARAQEDWTLLEAQEWPRALRMTGAFDLDLRSPFVAPEIVEIARTLEPPEAEEPPKAALRRAARELGLPEPLAAAPKRALQYGSGIHRLVARAHWSSPPGRPRPGDG